MRYFVLAFTVASLLMVAPSDSSSLAISGNGAYVNFNEKELTWRIGNQVIERTIRYDPANGSLSTTKMILKQMGPRFEVVPHSEGDFVLAAETAGGTPKRLTLNRDWSYSWQTANTPGNGGKLLTIHLQGVGSNKGFEVEACYEVVPGDSPTISKWLTLVNRSGSTQIVDSISYDTWRLKTPQLSLGRRVRKNGMIVRVLPPAGTVRTSFKIGDDGTAAFTETTGNTGLALHLLDTGGEIVEQNGAVTVRCKPSESISDEGGRLSTPKAVVAVIGGKPHDSQ